MFRNSIFAKGNKKTTIKMLGSAILFASVQVSIASTTMSSVFSYRNFCKDRETLQSACDSLRHYFYIGILWAMGTTLIGYWEYGIKGMLANIIANLAVFSWVMTSYWTTFKQICRKRKLPMPLFWGDKNFDGINLDD